MGKIKDNTKEVVEQVKDATATKKVVEKIIQIESSFLHHYKQHQAHT